MARTVPFTEARGSLSELLDELALVHEHVVITRNGKPAAVLLSADEYETLSALREGEEDVKARRLASLDEVRHELGLA
jgi:prevent-host-death family protein